MVDLIDGFTPYAGKDAEKYNQMQWWLGLTFGDILDRAADMLPDKVAFVDADSRLTYAQARDRVNRLAVSLMDLGVRPTDRVLVQLPNWNTFAVAFFALQKIGAIDTLLIDRYRPYEIKHLAGLSGATSWILPESDKKTNYLPIIDEVQQDSPRLENVILVNGSGHKAYLSLEKLIEAADLSDAKLAELANRRPDPMQVAHMGPTGGTTGLPKLVPRTHNDLVCGSKFCAGAWEMDIQDVCLLAGPIGHDLTFSKGFLGSVLTYGRCVFLDTTDPDDICRTIEQEKVSTIVWVPTLARRLVKFERLGDYDLSSLKKMHCGGGASLADLIQEVRDRLHCRFFNGYGATEGQTTLTRSGDDFETVKATVGRPTCPHDSYKVVDGSGNELLPNTCGELVIKGPGVFTGYYKNPAENEKVFLPDSFFRTGDLAMIDEKGYITLCGRLKEMINRGGESISSTEIEKLISEHPQVVIVAVVAMPDPQMGEKACAYIQPAPGSDLTFEKIIAFLKGRGSSVLHLPERIEFVETMPLTKTGKVDKRFLTEDINRKIATSYRSPVSTAGWPGTKADLIVSF
ncbi:Long-chain-fatty-acid--CoA ligase (EC [Olavius sp. associated proteobacterium Delta 1]|nr:Long-chain-fatty-acid--CoA ligase (EC [Olavius sp. associated proteobacterium Delta 1]